MQDNTILLYAQITAAPKQTSVEIPVKSWLESRGTPLNTNHSHYSAFRKESVPGLLLFVFRSGDPTYHFIVLYSIFIYIYCTVHM